jgi:hypothetical protein
MDVPHAPAEQTAGDLTLSRAVILAVLAASLMVGAFAISTQSFWIDEATSLIVAMAPNPAEAWKYAQAVGGSTIQMPLYHVYLYAWHKVFGSGEWAMRASNLPWFLLAQLAFLILLRARPGLAGTAALLTAVSPTVWMYLDEARPYLMQYAAGCWLVAFLVRLTVLPGEPVPRWLWCAMGAAVIALLGSSLLGVVWTAGFLAAFAWLCLSQPATAATAAVIRHGWLVVLFVACALALAVYYVWTWSEAGGGYHRAGLSWVSLPYVAYEYLGFAGYGPGKLELRSSVAGSVLRALPALAPLGLIIGALALFLLTHRPRISSRVTTAWALALALPAIIIFVVFFFASYRPLPRHFIPALPAVILALATVLNLAIAQKQMIWRAVAVLLPLLWLGSALNLRWRETHAKDDYRTAAAIAAAALRENREVWWAADAAAAYIYLTPVALEEVPGRAWAMQAPSWDSIRFKFPPRLIVISKPDIYDPQGSVSRYAAENRFVPALQLQAFTIFTREGDPLPGATP